MSHDQESDLSSTQTPLPLNETVRVAKYIAALFSSGADTSAVQNHILSPMFHNSSHDDRLYNLLTNNPRLKKDEDIIHMYILFVLLCYIIGTGLIVMKYVKKESPPRHFNRLPSRAISFTDMDSSEVWIRSASSYDTVCENYSEDDDSSERLRPSATSEVTYVLWLPMLLHMIKKSIVATDLLPITLLLLSILMEILSDHMLRQAF